MTAWDDEVVDQGQRNAIDGSDLSDADIAELIDSLTYSSYRHNREISPEVTPERWRKVFGPSTDAMEQKYQGEKR
jgi:hypothetical protein